MTLADQLQIPQGLGILAADEKYLAAKFRFAKPADYVDCIRAFQRDVEKDDMRAGPFERDEGGLRAPVACGLASERRKRTDQQVLNCGLIVDDETGERAAVRLKRWLHTWS